MEHKTFERAVPEGYELAYHIDAANKKTGLLFTLGTFIIMVPILLVIIKCADWSLVRNIEDLRMIMVFMIVFMLAYIVLHELTHGAVYKALTHEKLRFGITWSAAFCGVPDIYTYRDVALKSLVAPLTLFTVILLPVVIWLHGVNTWWYLAVGVVFTLHISGCIGDMYMTYLFLTKYKDPDTLMRDTGPEQWIYVRKSIQP